ncbi:MAG: efflux RND transporter permease subunit [Bryobacteraceae bacterium]|nr:efflux RND transporter permease subunit [Bryobacteraceae bacterium]
MGWIGGSIRRPVTVSMFVVAVLLFGWVSLDRLALNLLPDISYPSLTVQTDYLDAAPEEVEDVVTRPIEEAVGVVPGLTRVSSVSRSGQSEVVLEFAWKTNMDLASLEVREKLDSVTLPRDVQRPVLLRFDPSNDPVMRLQITGGMSLGRLRYAAEKEIKRTLESVDGVAAIKVLGGLEEQIRIEIDEKRLGEIGIPITEVTRVLAQENLNQASGSLYDLDASYIVRVLNQFRSVDEIRGIVLRDQQGRKVVLGDVAKVWRGSKDRETITRLNGRESVELAVYKEGDANAVTVARAVIAKLEAMKRAKSFPAEAGYEVVFNQAQFIENAISDVLSSAVLGGLLATVVLFVFLRDMRSTLTIGLSIPISIMATFALMYQTGLTLNLMSLGGVALGVGMLVDNSIVVLESVARHRRPGADLREAVFRGAKEVGTAVTASTLTTVAVFVPLIFVEGIAGQLFKDQALTITYSLLASLLVAMTLIPMVLALRWEAESEAAAEPAAGEGRLRSLLRFFTHDLVVTVLRDVRMVVRKTGELLSFLLAPALNSFHRCYNVFGDGYPRLLRWSLDHKRMVLVLTALLCGASGLLLLTIGGELIPPITQGEFTFEVRLPQGRALAHTEGVMRSIEKRVSADPEVRLIFTSIGGSNKNQFARDLREQHVGHLYVVMRNKQDKQLEARTIANVRAVLDEFPELAHSFSRPTLFSFKTPVEVEVYSDDLASLRQTSEKVIERLQRVPGLSDFTTSARLGSPEVQVRFDRDRLARLGLEESEVANMLRNKIRGDVASRYREEDKQIEILVRAGETDRNAVEDIRNLLIVRNQRGGGPLILDPQLQMLDAGARESQIRATPADQQRPLEASPRQQPSQQSQARAVPMRLGAVADIVTERGPSEVRRIRSQRAAVVSANLSGRDLRSVTEEIQGELQRLRAEIPPTTTIGLGGQNEELNASSRSLLLALGLAVFLVYLVMASQFESLVHPFLILFTVPLGAVGVILALALTRTPFSVMVFLGVIILAGIVVNNAIVLVDYTNQLREEGYSVREALIQAGDVRLRPILMTTLTTVLGLIPMAIGWGEGAEIRAPMAITVIGGLSFSTLLTLVFIPVIYEMANRERRVA